MGKFWINALRCAYFVYQALIQEVCDLQDVGDMMLLKRHITDFASSTIRLQWSHRLFVVTGWHVSALKDIILWWLLSASPCTALQGLIARFLGPTWGPSGADRTHVGPMLAPWTLLSGGTCTWLVLCWIFCLDSRWIWLLQAGTAINTHHNKWVASRTNTWNAHIRKAYNQISSLVQ